MANPIFVLLRGYRACAGQLLTRCNGRDGGSVHDDASTNTIHEYLVGILLPLETVHRSNDIVANLRHIQHVWTNDGAYQSANRIYFQACLIRIFTKSNFKNLK